MKINSNQKLPLLHTADAIADTAVATVPTVASFAAAFVSIDQKYTAYQEGSQLELH